MPIPPGGCQHDQHRKWPSPYRPPQKSHIVWWGRSCWRQGKVISKGELEPNVVNCGLVPKQEQSLSWLPAVPSLTAKPAEAFQWEDLAALDFNGPWKGEGSRQWEWSADFFPEYPRNANKAITNLLDRETIIQGPLSELRPGAWGLLASGQLVPFSVSKSVSKISWGFPHGWTLKT